MLMDQISISVPCSISGTWSALQGRGADDDGPWNGSSSRGHLGKHGKTWLWFDGVSHFRHEDPPGCDQKTLRSPWNIPDPSWPHHFVSEHLHEIPMKTHRADFRAGVWLLGHGFRSNGERAQGGGVLTPPVVEPQNWVLFSHSKSNWTQVKPSKLGFKIKIIKMSIFRGLIILTETPNK